MLKIENLRKVFRTDEIETIALDNVSFAIEKGEFVAVMGPSGCGKSTLLNILGLLDNPTSGSYTLLGQEVSAFREKDRTLFRKGNIGFVFQSFNLISYKNAVENVALPLYYQGVARRRRNALALEYLDMLGLRDWASHMPNEMSGGQKQRVAIARAIVLNPQYLFCDEPNSGLDPMTSVLIDNLIHEITQEYNITTVINTHDMNSVLEIGEHILFIYKGRKWWEGSKHDILDADNRELNDFVFASAMAKRAKKAGL